MDPPLYFANVVIVFMPCSFSYKSPILGEQSEIAVMVPEEVTEPLAPVMEASASEDNLVPEEVSATVVEEGALTMNPLAPPSTVR